MISIIEFLSEFCGETQQFHGKWSEALWRSNLVGKPKHNVQKPASHACVAYRPKGRGVYKLNWLLVLAFALRSWAYWWRHRSTCDDRGCITCHRELTPHLIHTMLKISMFKSSIKNMCIIKLITVCKILLSAVSTANEYRYHGLINGIYQSGITSNKH